MNSLGEGTKFIKLKFVKLTVVTTEVHLVVENDENEVIKTSTCSTDVTLLKMLLFNVTSLIFCLGFFKKSFFLCLHRY